MWNLFKVNNKDNRTTLLTSFWCFYCFYWTYFTHCSSDSILDFAERRYWRRSGVFTVFIEHISHIALVILFLTLNKYMPTWIHLHNVVKSTFKVNYKDTGTSSMGIILTVNIYVILTVHSDSPRGHSTFSIMYLQA